MRRILGGVLAAACILALVSPSLAAQVVIVNRARAAYSDGNNVPYAAQSNQVSDPVQPFYGIEISPDGTAAAPGRVVTASPAALVEIPYTLTNTGTADDSYVLSAQNEQGDNGDLAGLSIVVDGNGNGRADAFEIPYDNNHPPVLSPGEVLHLVVMGQTPAGLAGGFILVNLSGVSAGNSNMTDALNVARVDVSTEGFMTAAKSASPAEVKPGDLISYTLSFQSGGIAPVLPAAFSIDTDGNGVAENVSGILVSDALPAETVFSAGSLTFVSGVAGATPVYAGNDGLWRTSSAAAPPPVFRVGLFLPQNQAGTAFANGVSGSLTFKVSAGAAIGLVSNTGRTDYAGSGGPKTALSNEARVTVSSPARVVADDTDDGGALSGSGKQNDPDDLMVVDFAAAGSEAAFENEAANLGSSADTIELVFDPAASVNVPQGATVRFTDLNGASLPDSDGDGKPDLGSLAPGARKSFLTVVGLPAGVSGTDIIVAVKAVSSLDPGVTDLTFDKVGRIGAVDVKVEVAVSASVQAGVSTALGRQALVNGKIIAHEYDAAGVFVRSKVFLTDGSALIDRDENGNHYPLYTWLRDGYSYRITIAGEINDFSYYGTPLFYRSDFLTVENPGDVFTRGEITVKVLQDGTRLLVVPLDPAGYVYDAVTGARVDGACVSFYRCDGPDCATYTKVAPALLDIYPDGKTRQENSQLSGPKDGTGFVDTGKSPGSFEFRFTSYDQSLDGWYFIGTDFDCGLPGGKPDLGKTYAPVPINAGAVWTPASGAPYRGEKFYVDSSFPGAVLLRIPLYPAGLAPLHVEKTVTPSSAEAGDILSFTVTVKNVNDKASVFGAEVYDLMPRDVRYVPGSATVNGRKAADPAISADGCGLTFRVGDLAGGASLSIAYKVRVAAGATEGRKVNTAKAAGFADPARGLAVSSNTASAFFTIKKDLFTDRGVIVGKVFSDDNDNRIQDGEEQGLAGVKIYMEDGRYVVTDSEGKYHMDNVAPGTHVLKVDPTSLPPGAVLAVVDNRNAGDPATAFADLFPGDLFKVNFRVAPAVARPALCVDGTTIPGSLVVSRGISDVVTDAKGGISVRNRVEFRNASGLPLYEAEYAETSPYKPMKGTVTLNGAPFENAAEAGGGSFSWKLPLLEPGRTLTLEFLSALPKSGGKAEARCRFRTEPAGRDETAKVSSDVAFSVAAPNEYRISLDFAPGADGLSPTARESLAPVIQHLRKTGFLKLYVDIPPAGEGGGAELARRRAESVTRFFRESLIDTSKVSIGEARGGEDTPQPQTAAPAAGGYTQGQGVEIRVLSIGAGMESREIAVGDEMGKGIYRLRLGFKSQYPVPDLKDPVLFVGFPEGFYYMGGTADVNGAPASPVKDDRWFRISLDEKLLADPVYFSMDFLSSGPLSWKSTPVCVLARTKNGKTVVLASNLADKDPLVVTLSALYSSGGSGGTLDPGDVERVRASLPAGILYPESDGVAAGAATTLRIRVAAGAPFRLTVNGREVGKERLGQSTLDKTLGLETREYLGVPLNAPENVVELFSGETLIARRIIKRSGEAAGLSFAVWPKRPPADGKSPAYVSISLVDGAGNPVAEDTFLSVSVDRGDIFDSETGRFKKAADDGFTVRTVAGRAVVKLSPASTSEKRTLTARLGDVAKTVDVSYYPESRPLILVGGLEGGIGFGNAEPEGEPASADMPFDHSAGDTRSEGRAAFFGKGSAGGFTATLRYDTRANPDGDTLLMENTPGTADNRFYPVYGDDSEQFFEAKSAERLYLKVERNLSYAMFGDFGTDAGSDLSFNRYQRTMNGGLVNLEDENHDKVRLFVSRNRQSLVRETLPARGLSGPYILQNGDVTLFSETVVIETRDRYHPSVVVGEKTMSRNTDYDIDYDSGVILFHEPLGSFDSSFNPQIIRVTYETKNLDESRYIYGARPEIRFFSGKLRLGFLGVVEENAVSDKREGGADLVYDDGRHVKVTAEVSATDGFDPEGFDPTSGTARRVEAEVRDVYGTDVKARYQKVDEGYENLSSAASTEGSEVMGFSSRTEFGPDGRRTAVQAEFSGENGDTLARKSTELRVEQGFGKKLSLFTGARWARDEGSTQVAESVLAVGGVKASPTSRLSLSLRREQSLSGETASDYATTRTVGTASFRVTENVTTELATEYQERADRDVWISTAGVSSRLDENTTAYAKYGMDDSVSGWRNASNLGLTHQFVSRNGFTLDGAVEWVETLSGESADADYVAPRMGFTYLQSNRYKVSGREEIRFGDKGTESVTTLGGSMKAGRDLTLFTQARYFNSENDELNLLFGSAFRPVGRDTWQHLTKIRWTERSGDVSEERVVLSHHVNGELKPRLKLMGELAGKYVRLDGAEAASYLARGRVIYDVTDRVDIGFHAGILHQVDSGTSIISYGPEVGFLVFTDFWLSVGYNFAGFRDEDFSEANYWCEGPYAKVRIKFDENSLYEASERVGRILGKDGAGAAAP